MTIDKPRDDRMRMRVIIDILDVMARFFSFHYVLTSNCYLGYYFNAMNDC